MRARFVLVMRLPSAKACVDSVTESAEYGLPTTTSPITLPSARMKSTVPPSGITGAAPFATKNTVSLLRRLGRVLRETGRERQEHGSCRGGNRTCRRAG